MTALCTIPTDDDSYGKIYCEVSIKEYGIPHSLYLQEEPPIIEGVEIKGWSNPAQGILWGNCYMEYTYHINRINNYSIIENNDGKFIDIEATIKKSINITGEENTALTLCPFLAVDENCADEKTECNMTFDGAKDEDENATMICNVTSHAEQAIFIKTVPLEHNKNYYIYVDISNTVINLTSPSNSDTPSDSDIPSDTPSDNTSYSSFLYLKFLLLMIIFLFF